MDEIGGVLGVVLQHSDSLAGDKAMRPVGDHLVPFAQSSSDERPLAFGVEDFNVALGRNKPLRAVSAGTVKPLGDEDRPQAAASSRSEGWVMVWWGSGGSASGT